MAAALPVNVAATRNAVSVWDAVVAKNVGVMFTP